MRSVCAFSSHPLKSDFVPEVLSTPARSLTLVKHPSPVGSLSPSSTSLNLQWTTFSGPPGTPLNQLRTSLGAGACSASSHRESMIQSPCSRQKLGFPEASNRFASRQLGSSRLGSNRFGSMSLERIESWSCFTSRRRQNRSSLQRCEVVHSYSRMHKSRPWATAADVENQILRRIRRQHCVGDGSDGANNGSDGKPKRVFPPADGWVEDSGIASESDWNINLRNIPRNESGVNDGDGSSWYRESGEERGESGFRCVWTVMGGRSVDGLVEWKETWWEKSDWSGYKELGAEKSGRNGKGDSWWETWQEVFRQDEWSGLARIEKSAQKQAKSRTDGVWNEKWWEKYNAKGWTEKGAHKYGRFGDQSWWEKWGEQYDGRGAVVKWTDKWAEKDNGNKWGDKWEERFSSGVGNRSGETWHVSTLGNRWSRTWGEEHFGNGKVHKYGRSTSGELWDVVVNEPTYYQSDPHFGWPDAIASSAQLLAIEELERPTTPPKTTTSKNDFSSNQNKNNNSENDQTYKNKLSSDKNSYHIKGNSINPWSEFTASSISSNGALDSDPFLSPSFSTSDISNPTGATGLDSSSTGQEFLNPSVPSVSDDGVTPGSESSNFSTSAIDSSIDSLFPSSEYFNPSIPSGSAGNASTSELLNPSVSPGSGDPIDSFGSRDSSDSLNPSGSPAPGGSGSPADFDLLNPSTSSSSADEDGSSSFGSLNPSVSSGPGVSSIIRSELVDGSSKLIDASGESDNGYGFGASTGETSRASDYTGNSSAGGIYSRGVLDNSSGRDTDDTGEEGSNRGGRDIGTSADGIGREKDINGGGGTLGGGSSSDTDFSS